MNYNSDMETNPKNQPLETEENKQNRRELVTKLGKYAAYAAPFTVLALNSKAASGSGPKRH
jgi:formiminotetrahydrofolate cyclodeaminase